MLLAGDVGGTKTLLGLFEPSPVRPRPVVVRSFGTLEYDTLETMVAAFLRDAAINAAEISVTCVDRASIGRAMGTTRVVALNDLQAMAHAVPVLRESELCVLQQGSVKRCSTTWTAGLCRRISPRARAGGSVRTLVLLPDTNVSERTVVTRRVNTPAKFSLHRAHAIEYS